MAEAAEMGLGWDQEAVRGFLVAGHPRDAVIAQIVRAFGAVTGTACVLASVGLWILPGATSAAELLPFKLVLSGVFFLVGVSLIQLCNDRDRVEIQVDREGQEIRAVRQGRDGRSVVVAAVPFSKVGKIEAEAGRLVVADREDEVILQLVVADTR